MTEPNDSGLEQKLVQILESFSKKRQEREIIVAANETYTNMKNLNDSSIDDSQFNDFYNGFLKDITGKTEMEDLAKKLKVAYLYINSNS